MPPNLESTILNIGALIALVASPTLLFLQSKRFFDGTFTSQKLSPGTIIAFALTFSIASVRLGCDISANNYIPLLLGASLLFFAGIIYPYKKLLVPMSTEALVKENYRRNVAVQRLRDKRRASLQSSYSYLLSSDRGQTLYWGRQKFQCGQLAPRGAYTGRVHWGLLLALLSVAVGGFFLQCIPGFFF